MEIRTIVTDCDDTLLRDDLTISPFTRKVLKMAHDKGIRIILASGRAAASLRPYVDSLAFGDPYIACNGAVILDGRTHEVMNEVLFSVETAKECARFFMERGMYAQYYAGDYFHYSHEGEFNLAYSRETSMQGKLAGNLEKAIVFPVAKILGMDTPENIAKAYEEAMALLKNKATITMSKPYFLEMNPPGGSKGEALERLKSMTDILPETTMAFGDSLNDISMLRWAKYGVAMENGRDEVKNATKLRCKSNEADGVAHMILKDVLKEEIAL